MPGADFDEVFSRLKGVLEPYTDRLRVSHDRPASYALDLSPPERPDPKTYFAGVRRWKSYVSFYLMPVYGCPDLLDAASPALRGQMQGKACFNFRTVDEPLFDELAGLTARAFERYGSERYQRLVRSAFAARDR